MPEVMVRILGVKCGDCGLEAQGSDDDGVLVPFPHLMERDGVKLQTPERKRWCPDCGGQPLITMEPVEQGEERA